MLSFTFSAVGDVKSLFNFVSLKANEENLCLECSCVVCESSHCGAPRANESNRQNKLKSFFFVVNQFTIVFTAGKTFQLSSLSSFVFGELFFSVSRVRNSHITNT